MLKRKEKLILTVLFISALVFLFFLICKNYITKNEGNQHNEITLEFANNFISYVIEDNENGMAFNIFGVQNIKGNRISPLESLVSSVEFNNSNIKVLDYQIDSGVVYEDYRLFNIIITAQVLTNNVETADQLLFQFGNKDITPFNFGNITVQNNNSFQDKHFEPSGNYNVGYPTLSLDVNLKNKTNSNVLLSRIIDLTEEISYDFAQDYKHFNSQEKMQIKIEHFNRKSNENFDFMTITPILSYKFENQDYLYNMPGVIYGMLDPDIDKIKKIIN